MKTDRYSATVTRKGHRMARDHLTGTWPEIIVWLAGQRDVASVTVGRVIAETTVRETVSAESAGTLHDGEITWVQPYRPVCENTLRLADAEVHVPRSGIAWQPEEPAGHAPYCAHPSHSLTAYCAADPAEPATMRGEPSEAWKRDH